MTEGAAWQGLGIANPGDSATFIPPETRAFSDTTMATIITGQPQTVWEYRFAVLNLILKDFRVRYRNMSMGFMWSVLNPLVMLGVLIFAFTYIYPHPEKYHAIFLLLGLVAYNFFGLCLSAAATSIYDNASLVKKVRFPRWAIPVSVVFSQLIHVVIQLVILCIFVACYKVPITWAFLWLPVIYGIEFIFVMGMSLICSALYIYYRDVKYIVESGLRVLFWFTPIFYTPELVHQSLPRIVYGIYMCNPLAGLIDASRRAVIHGVGPDMISFVTAIVVSFLTLAIGSWVFHRHQFEFADYIA